MGFEIDHIEFHISVKGFYPRPACIAFIAKSMIMIYILKKQIGVFLTLVLQKLVF